MEGRRKQVMGAMEAVIKHFQGCSVEERIDVFFVFMTPNKIKDLLGRRHEPWITERPYLSALYSTKLLWEDVRSLSLECCTTGRSRMGNML